MRALLVFGFCVGLGTLVLLGVLVSPLAALAGLLALLLVTIAILRTHTIPVQQCTALVVCARGTRRVLRVVTGPATTVLRPLVEQRGPVLLTGYQQQAVRVRDLLQADYFPTSYTYTAYVGYRLAPEHLSLARLAEVLPLLTDGLGAEIERQTDHCLRGLAPDHGDCVGDCQRRRLERCLQQRLRQNLAHLGLAVERVQVVIQPAAGTRDVQAQAQQARLGIDLKADLLKAMLDAVQDQGENARLLALLTLADGLGRNGQALLPIQISSLLSGDGLEGQADLAAASTPAQLALWPELLESLYQRDDPG